MKAAALVAKQLLQVLTRQANCLHPPRTDEQPQAYSSGRRSLTAPAQSKHWYIVLLQRVIPGGVLYLW